MSRPITLLVIGESHLLPKTLRHYALLRSEHDIHAHFYIDDASGITRKTLGNNPPFVHYAWDCANRPLAWGAQLVGYVRLLAALKPDLIEVYTSRHPLLLLTMMALAKARGLPCVVVSRGECNPQAREGPRTIAAWALKQMFRRATLIVYKEPYMAQVLDEICPTVSRVFWHNAVPIGAEPSYTRQDNVVLFLNRFIPMRNVDLVIRAADSVRKHIPDVKFFLVGEVSSLVPARVDNANLLAYERALRTLIQTLQLEGVVTVLPFTEDVTAYFSRAKLYLLPADTVFCNYALLEAMERGVPAVVTDEHDEYARRIVTHEANGLVARMNETDIGETIVSLLRHEDRRLVLARAARQTVVNQYNLQTCLIALAEKIRALVPDSR